MMYPVVMVLSSCWFCRSELLYPAFLAITIDAPLTRPPYLDVKGSSGDETTVHKLDYRNRKRTCRKPDFAGDTRTQDLNHFDL
jgi:hypothetical protein